jgi:hypothetical protein
VRGYPPSLFYEPQPPAPTLTGLVDIEILEDACTGPLAFSVSDAEAPAEALAVTACSSNARLVPEDGIVLGGSGANRTIAITPAPDETGIATIWVTVDTGVFHANESFQVTVTPVGGDALRAVDLTAPSGSMTHASAVAVSAAVDDPDGALAGIAYYADGQYVGASDVWPFTWSRTNPAYGPHSVAAVATDMSGHRIISVPVAFTNYLPPLAAALIRGGSDWRYFDGTNDLGTAWRGVGYDDAAWSGGPAMLGFGDANGQLPATAVANNRQWTTYFRRRFVVPSSEAVVGLSARLQRDDEAVVYLNGVEVWRDNLPAGAITNATPASSAIGGAAESTWLTHAVSPSLLVAGTNLLAVEIHQSGVSSSDISFDFGLDATVVLPEQPSLQSTVSGGMFRLNWPAADAGAFALDTATNLSPPVVWVALTNAPFYQGQDWLLALPIQTNGFGFFRLRTR